MNKTISIISQKGGVGKSSIARTLAREFADNGLETLIADMDVSQSTSTEWNSIRMEQNIKPDISVQQFRTVESALKLQSHYDIIIFDGAPHATKQTLEMVKKSDLSILPTGISKDDLNPQIRLAHELLKNGVHMSNFAFVFCRVGNSDSQLKEATEYLNLTPYYLLENIIKEKDGYRMALDSGKALTETSFTSLNKRADKVMQEIFDNFTLNKEIKQ